MINEQGDIEPIVSGTRKGEDADSYSYHWAVFDRKEVEAWLRDNYPSQFENMYAPDGTPNGELGIWLTGWQRSYSGPGRGFCNDGYARVSRTRILVKQGCGLDI